MTQTAEPYVTLNVSLPPEYTFVALGRLAYKGAGWVYVALEHRTRMEGKFLATRIGEGTTPHDAALQALERFSEPLPANRFPPIEEMQRKVPIQSTASAAAAKFLKDFEI